MARKRLRPSVRPARSDYIPEDESLEYVHMPALTVDVPEGEEWSGLYDQNGHKLVRDLGLEEPIGFVHFPDPEE